VKASKGVEGGHVAAKQYGTRCQKARSARFAGFCRLFSENPQKDFLPQKVPPKSRQKPAYWRSKGCDLQAIKFHLYNLSRFAGCGNAGFYSRQTRFPARQYGLPARFIPPLSIADQQRL
jgi:hypothetical protein